MTIDFKQFGNRYQRYYTYLEPVIADPLVRGYFSLIASLFLISFFIIFALSPTVDTILSLRKKIADQKSVQSQLETKIVNIVSAQENFAQIEPQIPLLLAALPDQPYPQSAISGLYASATNSAVEINSLQFKNISLGKANLDSAVTIPPSSSGQTLTIKQLNLPSIGFSLSASGRPENVELFLTKIESLVRYIRLSSLGVNFDPQKNTETISVNGISFYYQN